MQLKKLLQKTDIFLLPSQENIEIKNIITDNRKVQPGDLFIAYEGIDIDSHQYIDDVLAKGAELIIGTQDLENKYGEKYIRTQNSRRTLSLISANWFGNPSQNLKIIGITGTDGKTTTSNMVYQILLAANKKVTLLTTINSPGLHVTTPDSLTLQGILRDFVNQGYEWVILETSSHSLAYNNVYGIHYTISGLTNITLEHLDFHKTFENYVHAKSKLFLQSKISILPNDEIGKQIGDFITQFDENQSMLFHDGQTDNENFAQNISISKKHGISFYDKNNFPTDVELNIPGEHNILNASLAAEICRKIGITEPEIKSGLENVKDLSGRWEIVYDKKFYVIIDHAHTPNSIEAVLKSAQEFMKYKILSGRLIHIFGAAGERDHFKREEMGRVSAKYADKTILTCEDPRSEKIHEINIPIRKGLEENGSFFYDLILHSQEDDMFNKIQADQYKKYFEIPWRGSAISFAVGKLAHDGDLILITGKGHETSMAFGKVEYLWTDQEAVRENLKCKV